jgi:glycerophosphoryl diester phosphodiesterase
MKPVLPVVADLGRMLRRNWRQFLVIHIVVNVVIFVIFGPLAGFLLHLVVALSGEVALSDQDILFFLLRPVGLVSMLLVASVMGVIIFLETAALMTAAYFESQVHAVSGRWLSVFLGKKFVLLIRLSMRIIIRMLLIASPFLLILAGIFYLLLSEYDINYYLSTQPSQFRLALVLGAIITLGLIYLLLRKSIDWVFALPLVLFNDLSPAEAMSSSREAANGQRLVIGGWILGWLIFSLVLLSIASGAIAIAGHYLIPLTADTFNGLLIVLAVLSVCAFILNFVVLLLESSLLSLISLSLFRWRGLEVETTAGGVEPGGFPYDRLLTRSNLVWASIAGLLVALLVVNGLLGRLRLEDRTEVIAHRGASMSAPENTLAAVQGAIEAKSNWVEIDVQETADGEIVVIHDSDLKKIGGTSLRVSNSNLEELQQVDIGSWFGPQFSDQRIPTLVQILELCKGRIKVNIELKYYGDEQQLEQSVVKIVEAAGMKDEVMVMSLSYSGIKKMRAIRPSWKLGLLSSVALGNVADLDVDFIAINARFATRNLIRNTHSRDKQLLVWTVNDPLGISTMINRGVDGIITDDPALAVSVIEERAELDATQRLLMQLADVFEQPSLYREQ